MACDTGKLRRRLVCDSACFAKGLDRRPKCRPFVGSGAIAEVETFWNLLKVCTL